MKKNNVYKVLAIGAIGLVAGIVLGRLSKGDDGSSGSKGDSMNGVVADSQPSVWTCSMHPQITQPDPGDCPICGMDLIPLDNDDDGNDNPRVLRMSSSAKALAEIETVEVIESFPELEVRLLGKLEYDETLLKSISARFPARMDELYVNFTGIRVWEGDHLAKIYSPELLTAQRELITAHRGGANSSIARASREKLRLWGLLPEQIEEILISGEASDSFILKAPESGIVISQNVKEGDYVQTGDVLFKIADLQNLWAYLNAYESDYPWLRYGQDVIFTVEALPGETFEGVIAFIDQEVNRDTRTIPVRVNVSNEKERLKPGMFVRGIVKARLDATGSVYSPDLSGKWISPMHPEVIKDGPGACDVCGMELVPAEDLGWVNADRDYRPIVVPASAVLRTGKRAVVYVEEVDAERPSYEGREVVLGPRAGDVFIVERGLEVGERVVTHGAFKIDSALQIQARPSMMNPKETLENSGENVFDISIQRDMISELIDPYLKLQSALAEDDYELATRALDSLMTVVGHTGKVSALIHEMMDAQDLEAIRKPYFDILSQGMIQAVLNYPEELERDLYLMNCPMVYGDTGADWLQSDNRLRNPYFGAMMYRCGELIEAIQPKELPNHEH